MSGTAKCTPALIATLREEAPRHKTLASLARRLDVSQPTVVAWGRKHGVRLPVATRGPQADRASALLGVEMPPWVPAHLVDEFWRVAEVEGEYAARARVRALKAGERRFTQQSQGQSAACA